MCRCPRTPAPATLPEVDADVEPVRLHHARERVLAAPRELQQVGEFLVRQAVQIGRLPVRHDHEMPAGVGIGVEQRVASAVARDDVIGLVIAGLGDAREEALGVPGLGRQDVFNPPRSVQWFHRQTLVREAGNVKNVRLIAKGRPMPERDNGQGGGSGSGRAERVPVS